MAKGDKRSESARVKKRQEKLRREERKPGFWGIPTNLFDRIFLAVVIMVAFHLLWMRFLEDFATIRIANVIAIAFTYISARWG